MGVFALKSVQPKRIIPNIVMSAIRIKSWSKFPEEWRNYVIKEGNHKYLGVGPLMFANHSCAPNSESVGVFSSDNHIRAWSLVATNTGIQKHAEISNTTMDHIISLMTHMYVYANYANEGVIHWEN